MKRNAHPPIWLPARNAARRCLLLLSVALLATSAAFGQTPLTPKIPIDASARESQTNAASSGDTTEAVVRAVQARLAEARTQLGMAEAATETNLPAGISPQEFWTQRMAMHRLVLLYGQQLDNITALTKARARRAETEREARDWTRFAEPPPYSILLPDRLRQEIHVEERNAAGAEASGAVLQRIITENRATLQRAEEQVRQLNEQLETAREPAVAARLAWLRNADRLRSQMAAATIAVLDLERLIAAESLATGRARSALLRRQLVIADAGVRFTQADLDQITAQIDRQYQQIAREMAGADVALTNALRELESARSDLRGAAPGPAAERLAEIVMTREAQGAAAESRVSVLRLMLEAANIERVMWGMRFAAHDSRSLETLHESRRRLGEFAGRMGLWREFAGQQLESAAGQLQVQELRRNDLAADSGLRPLMDQRLEAMRERERMIRRFHSAAVRLEQLVDRWSEGVEAATGRLAFPSRVRSLFSDARSFGDRFWTFEVFAAEDTITVDGQQITGRRSVTIGKIVMALLILVVGYWFTGLIAALVEPMVVKRLRIEANQAELIRRWFRAFLVVCLVVFSLVSVKIPLTVFAFAGGALAIGLGFGMQTILKNLVSGLILLFERPFRVGDTLDVGGQRGTVSSIGLRASVLQLWDGTETLIPNSSLLENNVTNWTYSNRRVRFAVTVGVAYGSDPRRIVQLLSEAAERHGLVEREPKPVVLFVEFGESTLNFELRFWVDVAKANSAQISSDLRLMIAGLLAENGISIAYPQRDVHLHADRPITVQMASPVGTSNASPAPDRPDLPAREMP